MLIVCPNCATSYMIDQTSVGPAGRAVRCARCKTTWFAGGPEKPDVTAYVDSVIAEAEAQTRDPSHNEPPARSDDARPARRHAPMAADDFQNERPAEQPHHPMPAAASLPVEPATTDNHLVPHDEPAAEPLANIEAPSLVPPIEHAPLPQASSAETDNDDIESFAARRQRLKVRRQKSRKSTRWTAIILVLFAFNVALIGARHEVVRYLPQTASLFSAIGLPVNLRNLKFDNVRISKETQDGVGILVVEGNIVSTTNKPAEVPRLRFAARNASGQEVYSWTALPSRSILGPGETLEFSSQLASPPADASDVMVRFFNAQDAAAAK
jgi:predicted Zn finger-like uncharacterized protein